MVKRIMQATLVLLTLVMLIYLYSQLSLARRTESSPGPVQSTIPNLQVNRSGVSSTYQITNLSSQLAHVTHEFYANGTPPSKAASLVSQISPNGREQIDLGQLNQLPGGFQGFVIISSNQPITDTNNSSSTPTATATTAATPTHTMTATAPNGTPPVHPDGWDLAFGGDGQAETHCGGWTIGIWAGRLAIQADDKILIFANCAGQATLLRYLANGAPDTSFGVNGKAVIIDGLGMFGMPALQSDGKVLVANGQQVARYTTVGALDTTFGANGLTAPAAALAQIGDFAQLLVQPDDRIVVRGANGLARFTSNGLLDPTLNQVGYVRTDNLVPKPRSTAEQYLMDIAVQADHKLLLAFYTIWTKDDFDQTVRRKTEIIRLHSDGSVDQSFGNGGLYQVAETTQDNSYPGKYVVVQPTGQILSINLDTRQLIRLQPNGVLDSSFQSPAVSFDHLLLDQQGFILLHGGYWTHRLWPNGALDRSWGNNGQLDWNGGFVGLGLQQDGSLVVNARAGANGFTLMRNVKSKQHPSPTTPTPGPTPEPSPTPTMTPLPPTQRALALIYAVLDNNLGSEWTRLVNNIEAGAHPGVDVRLLIDGPAVGDAYLYTIQPDQNPYCPTLENPTCGGRYREGVTYQRFATEDTARPQALYQFLVDSFNAYPQAPQLSLTIIGHGSGWGANALPAQPSIWRDQNDTLGGMLWDDHTGAQSGTRSLSTLALGQALHWATNETGRTLNLLYLDGCSMGMTEVAYELRNRADYLLASPNTDWATFAYDQLLPLVRYDRDGRTLGAAWLTAEAALLRSRTGYPFTLALTNLRQLSGLPTTVSALADALHSALPTQRDAITLAYQQSDRFDSNYDAKLDVKDTYLDLRDFTAQLPTVGITDTVILSRAQAVQTVLSSLVVTATYENGAPWLAEDQQWSWHNLGGLSIYAPLHQDEAKRRIYYTKENLAWATDSTWDEFLTAFWVPASNAAATTADMPVCHATTQGCQGLANPLPVQTPVRQFVYLPVAQK